MPKPSRWTPEKRYEIVMEILRGKESITQIARKHQVSDALMHRWRERFYEGGKAALNFEAGPAAASRSREQALEQKIEELEKVIGQQAVEIRFLKKLSTI
jgi:transposase